MSNDPDHTPTKICSKCRRELPATREFFAWHSKTGLCNPCLACFHAAKKLWNTAHPHRNRVKPTAERRRINDRRYREKHLERVKERERVKLQRRITRRRNLPATFSAEDWNAALAYFRGCCAVCGRPPGLWHMLAMDHWIAVSKGGAYTPDNIVPLCQGVNGCNNRKGDRDAREWLIEQFGPRKACKILKEIETYFDWVRENKNG